MDTVPLQEVKYETGKPDKILKSENVRNRDTWFLWTTVLTGSIISVFMGLLLVWLSSAIPKLKSNNTNQNPLDRPITTFEISMLAGIPTLAMLLGSIAHNYLSELVGRKVSIQIATVGICISTVALACSRNIICIIAFRSFLLFFCNGGFIVFLIYITEICEDHNRAKFGCLSGAFLPFGQIIGFAMGAFFNFKYFTLAELSPIIILVFFIYFAPESPVYSLSNNKIEDCVRSLRKLRNNKSETELETDLRKINETIIASKKHKGSVSIADLFNSKERRYALMLALLPMLQTIFCGIGIILPFLEPIFLAAETNFNSSHMPIIVAVFKFFTFFTTSIVVEKYGRKILMVISSIGSAATMFSLGCFFYLKSINYSSIHQLQWLPLVCTIFYVILYSSGMGSIPQATMSELFTPDIRSMAVSFLSSTFSILLFCSSASYPYIVESLGLHWCLWIYSGSTFLGTIFMYLIIPENKGKSIVEIQNYIKLRCNK